jgi:hypothetical protein
VVRGVDVDVARRSMGRTRWWREEEGIHYILHSMGVQAGEMSGSYLGQTSLLVLVRHEH